MSIFVRPLCTSANRAVSCNEHDLFFMQGFVHAEDRLFRMDLLRRQAAGTLAELLGRDALPNDVELRTIGLGRAAERSLNAHSEEMMEVLQAYNDGVNVFIEAAGTLPPEYGILQLTTVERWNPLSTLPVGKALGAATSFRLGYHQQPARHHRYLRGCHRPGSFVTERTVHCS